MAKSKIKTDSLGSKLFTAIFSGLLVVLMVCAFIYVAVIPDFVKPQAAAADIDPRVWDCNMDDLFDYFEEKGIMTKSSRVMMSDIGTENWICNGVDLVWWDVSLNEDGNYDESRLGGAAKSYWNEYKNNDFLYVMFGNDGTVVYSLINNGPFAVNPHSYPGNSDDFIEAFMAFPGAWSGCPEE